MQIARGCCERKVCACRFKGRTHLELNTVLASPRFCCLFQEGSTTQYKDTSEYTLKLLIHKFLAGCIIGKGGSIIRELQSATGARISLSSDKLGTSTEKSVSISGSSEVIHEAVSRVLTQLKENPLRQGSSSIPYVPGVTVTVSAPTYNHPPNMYGMPSMVNFEQNQLHCPLLRSKNILLGTRHVSRLSALWELPTATTNRCVWWVPPKPTARAQWAPWLEFIH